MHWFYTKWSLSDAFIKVWKVSGTQHYLPPKTINWWHVWCLTRGVNKRWGSELSFPIPGTAESVNIRRIWQYTRFDIQGIHEYETPEKPMIHDWFHKFAYGIMKQFYLFLTFGSQIFNSGSGTRIFRINELNFCWKRCVPLYLCPDRGFFGIMATGLTRPDCMWRQWKLWWDWTNSKLHLKRLFWHMPLPLSHGLVNSDLDLQYLPWSVCPKI